MREQDNRGGINHSDCKSADARESKGRCAYFAVCLYCLELSLRASRELTFGVVGRGHVVIRVGFRTRFLFFSHAFSFAGGSSLFES